MNNFPCIFCGIAKGSSFAYTIFEDDRVIAFLDTHPISKGHTLIIPKVHVTQVEDLTREDADSLFKTLYQLVGLIQTAVEAQASTIAINNGLESGQEIPHVHVHIIPRFRDNGSRSIHTLFRRRSIPPSEEMERIAQKIRHLRQQD